MRDLNIDFLEEYKSVDKFIKDANGSAEGVSEFIRTMETYYIDGLDLLNAKEWTDDFKLLKNARYIRNQLVHEAGIDADICDEDDYDWLCDFRERLFSGNDPLVLLQRAKSRRHQAQPSHSTQEQFVAVDKEKDYHIHFNYDPPIPEEKEKKVPGVVWVILIIVIVGVLKI